MNSRWFLVSSLALAACTEPRQIVLSIDTTAGIPCDIDHLRVTMKAAETTKVERSLQDARLPVTITLLDDTPNGSFDVEVSGLKGDVEVLHDNRSLQFSDQKTTETILLVSKNAMSAGAASDIGYRSTCRYSASVALDSHQDACRIPESAVVSIDSAAPDVPVRLMEDEAVLLNSGLQFYGQPIHQIWVSKNGYISFARDNPDPSGDLLPGPLDRDITHAGEPPPPQSMMVFWDTLFLNPQQSSSKICYALQGTPGNHVLRVTWSQVCLTKDCGSDNLNFTITLEEAQQRIAFTYGTMMSSNMDRAHGTTATVGIVKEATGCPANECTLATGLCQDGVTPCGYSQVFSNTLQDPRVSNRQFGSIEAR